MQSFDDDMTLHAAFLRAASTFPGRVAVVDDESSLTYAELDARSDAVAAALRETGAASGLVALQCRRCVDLITAILGILKAGAAYVPLDPEIPADRVRFILADSGAAVLVLGDGVTAPDTDVPVLQLASVPPAPPGPALGRGEDLAYVIYTSGSTGQPKGVMVEHRQVLELFRAAAEVFAFDENDTWTLFHSYAFDFSVWEIFGALLAGGSLVVVAPEATRSPEAMWRLIRREGVTVLNQTPSYFTRLAEADEGDGAGLRYIILGGEALDFTRLRRWYARYGDTGPQLVNMYGITETTVHVTYRALSSADAESRRSLIGIPLPHLAVQVLDDELKPVGLGQVGELCVSGTGLARGYLGREQLTATQFVVDASGQRVYRSGDVGRMLPDGDLEYLGRADDQVKVRGYRIEPGEIQLRLLDHPAVADAVVTTWEGTQTGTQLVGYLVTRAVVTDEELRAFLAEVLPRYMVPGRYVRLPELPLNHNGKLDRDALPTPGVADAPAAETADGLVSQLLAIWQQVLEVDSIGPDDRFFTVGGDSIQAIRIVTAARSAGITMSIDDLISDPTVATLAEAVSSAAPAADAITSPYSLIDPADRGALPAGLTDAYPIMSLQLGMLFHGDETGGAAKYHSVSSATVPLAFDHTRLHECLARLLARHEALRTSFDVSGFTMPLQLVHAAVGVPLAVTDLRGRAADAQRTAVAAMLDRETRTPFSPDSVPLVRFRVMVLSDAEFVFVWCEHHAIMDGWSSNSLLAEVLRDYADAFTPPGELPLMRDYVAAELAAAADDESRRFWSGYLAGLPAALHRRPADLSEVTPAFPAGTYARLTEAALRAGLTPRALIVGAVAVAFGRHQGRSNVVVGHVSHGRLDRRDSDQALGLFLNTLPLRLRLTGTHRDVAGQAAAAIRATGPHRRYPFAAISRDTGLQLDILVNFTDFRQLEALVADGLIDGSGVRNTVRTSFSLVVDAARRGVDGELSVTIQFQDEEWTPAARQAFADTLAAALLTTIDAPGTSVDASGTPVVTGEHRTALHDIIATAATCPDVAAVAVGRGDALTYGELVTRARKLAVLLGARGVLIGDTVAMCLPRTADLLVGTLGVWWAGATLVPLEPDYPAQRRAYVLDDARAAAILGSDVILAGLDWSTLSDDPSLEPRCGPGDAAYLLYTSGSTGQPKGVVVEHRSMQLIMRATAERIELTPRDVVLGWTSVTFDIAFVEHVAALLAGARLELLTEAEGREPGLVAERIRDRAVTVVQGTPSRLATIADAELPTVRAVIAGGEPLPPALVTALSRGGAVVWNGYGPTEATIYTTFHRLTAAPAGPVPIGRPLPGVLYRIVSEHGDLVTDGAPGELWIGGVGVVRGYWRRPELTAAQFVARGGVRYYRSGDLVQEARDGVLLYLGRIDQQIKVNGVRIEIPEIEYQIAQHPAVDAVAVVLESRADGSGLTAYVVPGEIPVDVTELREFLADRVPAPMIPTHWRFVAKLPLTTSGKVDRVRLGAGLPVTVPPDAVRAIEGPAQALVAEVWQAALGRRPVSRDDRFGDLGGDSLAAMRAVGQYARRGITIRAAQILAQPSVAQQAGLVSTGGIHA